MHLLEYFLISLPFYLKLQIYRAGSPFIYFSTLWEKSFSLVTKNYSGHHFPVLFINTSLFSLIYKYNFAYNVKRSLPHPLVWIFM